MDEINERWYNKEDEEEVKSEYSFTEYDIISSPNDFNIKTLFNFIEEGVMEIPGFQRNYVWDIKRASKLIESIIMGLPIPQIFLYEQGKNKFLVIDGQQRLMTIYYFKKQKFPKKEYRVFIGKIFDKEKKIPDKILHDDKYFRTFNLNLPEHTVDDKSNPLDGLNYSTLNMAGDECQRTFDLRTIRNIIIKQYRPPEKETEHPSSIYEIFSRLNTGGMNLRPQEIRLCLYHSRFYDLLDELNRNDKWRKLIGKDEEDVRLKDIEIILRAFAILKKGYHNYSPSMVKFLNTFSKEMKNSYGVDEGGKKLSNHLKKELEYYEKLFSSFLDSCKNLQDKPFHSKGKFNISMFDAIFVTMCEKAFQQENKDVPCINQEKLNLLKKDQEFIDASFASTTGKKNVQKRIERAKNILLS